MVNIGPGHLDNVEFNSSRLPLLLVLILSVISTDRGDHEVQST